MAAKRIVIFTTAYLPLIGGAEIAIKELTDRLVDFEFTVITPRLRADLPTEENIGRTKVIRIGTGKFWDKILFWRDGAKVAEVEGNFDLIWSVMASYGGLAALRYKKRHKGVPFFLNLQEGDSLNHIYLRALLVWPWFKQIFTHADFVQTLSHYLAFWAKRMGATCPVKVVPNGVALKSSSEMKNKKPEEKIILSVSRLVKKNGLEYLIRAGRFLPADFKIKIVGDGPLRVKLSKLIQKLDLSKQVELVGEVPNDKLQPYYAEAKVFVRPSLSEGLGISFLEAMEQGVPVIAPPVGGIPDFLQDGVTGWFCKRKNPEDIASKIMMVLGDHNQDKTEQVIKKAKTLISTKYSWDIITNEMKKILNTLLCTS